MPTKDSPQQFVADLAKGRRCPSFKSIFWRSEKVTVGLNLFLHLLLWFYSFSTQNEFGGELTLSLLQCGDAVTSRWEDREDRADGRWWVSAASVWEGNWWKTRRSWSWLVKRLNFALGLNQGASTKRRRKGSLNSHNAQCHFRHRYIYQFDQCPGCRCRGNGGPGPTSLRRCDVFKW